VEYLKKFRALSSPADIAAWHTFCKQQQNKKLQSGIFDHSRCPVLIYLFNQSGTWLLPGFNEHLSLMPHEFWDRTPHHTNLVETAHAGTHRSTKIDLRPLKAIQRCVFSKIQHPIWPLFNVDLRTFLLRAREVDASTAASIAAENKTCILRNPHNTEFDRVARAVGRRAKSTQQCATQNDLDASIDVVREQISAVSHTQKDLKMKLKGLTEKRKEVGHAKQGRSASNYDDAEIPLIRGLGTGHIGSLERYVRELATYA
jgi:hypothetical protein